MIHDNETVETTAEELSMAIANYHDLISNLTKLAKVLVHGENLILMKHRESPMIYSDIGARFNLNERRVSHVELDRFSNSYIHVYFEHDGLYGDVWRTLPREWQRATVSIRDLVDQQQYFQFFEENLVEAKKRHDRHSKRHKKALK